MEFLEELKKVATKRLGNIDHLSDYMVPFIISMLYFMQVLYFINKSFDISILLLLAIPLSLIFVFVAEKSRNLILKPTTKKFQITLFIHIIVSFIFFYIWSKTISVDYILYHMLMACFVYGVPILVMINAYAINTNNYFSNKQQSEIYAEVDKIKKTILKNDKIKNEHMKYAVALKVNGIYSSKYEELIRKLNI